MKKRLLFAMSVLGLSSCSVNYTSSGQGEGDPNMNCLGMSGKSLHQCAALATGFSQSAMRDFDLRCQSRSQYLGMSRATRTNRQTVVCQKIRPSSVAPASNGNVARLPDISPVDPNSPRAVSFGGDPTMEELAQAQNIPAGGGIRQSYVVLTPNDEEWGAMLARTPTGVAELHVKPIQRGDTIAKASRYSSNTQGSFSQGQIPTLHMSEVARHDSCKIIVDGYGEPLTIRDNEEGINRYGFYHAINDAKFWYQLYERQVAEVEARWKKQESRLNALKSSLENNRAYQGEQCVSVAQKRIPPAPDRIDPEVIELNAHGACINMVGSRFGEESVIGALESAGRWDMTGNFQKWSLGEKMSCSVGATVNEFESLKCRGIQWFAPNLGKDYISQCIRADINSCVADVKRSCDNGYGSWSANRQRIINEPKQLKAQCNSKLESIENFDYTAYNTAKLEYERIVKLRDDAFAKQAEFDRSSFIQFSDERSYCSI